MNLIETVFSYALYLYYNLILNKNASFIDIFKYVYDINIYI